MALIMDIDLSEFGYFVTLHEEEDHDYQTNYLQANYLAILQHLVPKGSHSSASSDYSDYIMDYSGWQFGGETRNDGALPQYDTSVTFLGSTAQVHGKNDAIVPVSMRTGIPLSMDAYKGYTSGRYATSLVGAADVPLKESFRIRFGVRICVEYAQMYSSNIQWPGFPVVEAYPVLPDLAETRLSKATLVNLVQRLVFQYFKLCLSIESPRMGHYPTFLYIPPEYATSPVAFMEKYVNFLRLAPFGARTSRIWVPVLGIRGVRRGPEGSWRLPVY